MHNCGYRSGGHHGEGVKDDIRRVDFEWYRLANYAKGIVPLATAKLANGT